MFIKSIISFLLTLLVGFSLFIPQVYAEEVTEKVTHDSYLVMLDAFSDYSHSIQLVLKTPLFSTKYEESFEDQRIEAEILAMQLCHTNHIGAENCSVKAWRGPNYIHKEELLFKKLESAKLPVSSSFAYDINVEARSDLGRNGVIHLIQSKQKYSKKQCLDMHRTTKTNKELCDSLCNKSKCTLLHDSTLNAGKLAQLESSLPITWNKVSGIKENNSCIRLQKIYCEL